MESSNERTNLHLNRDEENDCFVRTKLERRLIITIIIITIVGLGLCIGLAGNSKGKTSEASNVCFTPQCISTAAHLLNSMDFEQNPCDDFYSFVCGNWIKNHYLVGELTTQFTRINNLIAEKVKDILDVPHANATEHEEKTRQFYRNCMDMKTRDERGTKFLKEDLKTFGGWPMIEKEWAASSFNWSELMITFFQHGYPTNMLFDISVDGDIKNTSNTLIIIDQPLLALEDRRHYLSEDDSFAKRYKSFISDIALALNPDLDKKIVAEDIEDAFDIAKRLARATTRKLSLRHPDEFYNIMTLEEIEKFSPKIPWRRLVKAFLSPDTKIHKDQKIMVTNPHLLKNLNEMFVELDNDTGKRALANYMMSTAALHAAEHLHEELFFLYESKMHRSQAIVPWKVCYRTTVKFFHLSLTASYTRRYMDLEGGLSSLKMMFQDIKTELLRNIKQADWLDNETKDKAVLKIEKSLSAIAFREEILDDDKMNQYYNSIQIKEDYFQNIKAAYSFKMRKRLEGLNAKRPRFYWSNMENLLVANAFYEPSENAIVIPVGILQEAFFSPDRPNYINYGSLGTILGHEYTHAFDNSGALYNEDGNYKMWWTNQSWINFQKKEQCYIDQYSQYYESQVDSYVNGNKTLGENMADNGGVAAVYEAYLKLLERIGNEKQLPGLSFSERQMFWIAHASAWCRRQTVGSIEYLMENSVHAPAKFRVNGALSNIIEFSEDFKCGAGSSLNPSTKCSLWK